MEPCQEWVLAGLEKNRSTTKYDDETPETGRAEIESANLPNPHVTIFIGNTQQRLCAWEGREKKKVKKERVFYLLNRARRLG